MKLLITGSRGFVGGTLGRYAGAQGHSVLGISRAAQPDADWPGAYISADVVTADLAQTIRDFAPNAIFHAAGTASVGASFSAPLEDLRASLLSWANVLNSVRRSGTQPLLVFPSSGAVYGQLASLPVAEDAPISPLSPYGFHKAACELLAREYVTCFDQRILVCRMFSLFGARQRRLLVWELFKQFAGAETTVWLDGSGNETRDYLPATSLAEVLVQLIEREAGATRAGNCSFLNIASGEQVGVLDLARQIGMFVAPGKEIRCRGLKRPGDPERWQADTTQLRSLLPGWKPEPFSGALRACITSWQKK